MTPTLRPYQLDVLERARGHLRRGTRRVLIQGATGSGKGHVIAEVARCAFEKGVRTLILNNRRRIIGQLGDRLDLFGVPHGVIMAGRGWKPGLIQLASRDTLMSGQIESEWPWLLDSELILVDEAHGLPSAGYSKLIERFPKAFVVGFTATPTRADGKGMGNHFDALECTVPIRQLIAEGFLVPPRCFSARSLGEKRKAGKKIDGLAGDPVSHWKKWADGRPTVLFAGKVSSSLACMELFRSAGIPAEHVDAKTPDEEDESRQDTRDAAIRRLRSGKTLVVCNVGLWLEGVDIPELSCAILYRKFGSYPLYLQAVGRVLRSHPGKSDAIIIDHSGAVIEHLTPDNDVAWTLDATDSVDRRNREAVKKGERLTPVTCPACSLLHNPAPACPACGHKHVKRARARAEQAEHERLVEINDCRTTVHVQREAMQRQWKRFLFIAAARGQRANVALAMFNQKFKKLPWVAGVEPLPGPGQWREPVADLFPEYARNSAAG